MKQDSNQDFKPLIQKGTFRSIHWPKIILTIAGLFIYGCLGFFLGYKFPSGVNNIQDLIQNTITPQCVTNNVCISSISPYTVQVGTVITLRGNGFEPSDNYIYLTSNSTTAGNYANSIQAYTGSIPSVDSTRIEFTIPTNLTTGGGGDPYYNLCHYFSNSCSTIHDLILGFYQVIPGNYKIQVLNKHGLSNSLSLTIR